MSQLWSKGLLIATTALLASQPSQAKPDLTTPTDMRILHQSDSGYRFVTRTFSQPAPALSTSEEAANLQAYAKPRQYQVWLAIPNQPQQNLGQRVLYLLDGNAVIDELDEASLVALSRDASTPPALVFIGYQTPYRFDVDARAYDYTPPILANNGNKPSAFKEAGRERLNGGAQQYYELIENEIKPWVYQQLGSKPREEALWGHSYGGLFVLFTLFEHPESYQQYFSADPSLWWQKGEILNYWQAYQRQSTAPHGSEQDNGQYSGQYAHNSQQDKTQPNRLRLTFSEMAAKQSSSPARPRPALPIGKQEFAEEVCSHFVDNCSYQLFEQSHGELFGTSWRDAVKQFASRSQNFE